MLFSTLEKNYIEKCPFKFPGGGGGGGVEFFFFKQFFLISRFMLFSTLKKIYCHLLVKREVVSPNSRWGQWESIYPI